MEREGREEKSPFALRSVPAPPKRERGGKRKGKKGESICSYSLFKNTGKKEKEGGKRVIHLKTGKEREGRGKGRVIV